MPDGSGDRPATLPSAAIAGLPGVGTAMARPEGTAPGDGAATWRIVPMRARPSVTAAVDPAASDRGAPAATDAAGPTGIAAPATPASPDAGRQATTGGGAVAGTPWHAGPARPAASPLGAALVAQEQADRPATTADAAPALPVPAGVVAPEAATPRPVDAAATATRATPPPPIAQQVAPMAVALALGPGSSPRLTLSLAPAELGRVEISIHRAADGSSVAVHVSAERPETLALLQRDAPELDRTLQQAGLGGAGERSLSFSLGGQGGGGQGGGGQGWDGPPPDQGQGRVGWENQDGVRSGAGGDPGGNSGGDSAGGGQGQGARAPRGGPPRAAFPAARPAAAPEAALTVLDLSI
ncbi:flagellar hook-length control protein FliK [Roseomonas sp. NAR14]|uniref:Flagellar hook-length control protein FliK n=1 Tax=Roseomonas acroporae TaxID=2937791 RepID=A0A9X2BVS0_9PROT|nr:flagellar hook-length control protein FliK [Roseomonas acroporae]MCK8783045.1 flagellar hook-length control protein FliK [Roseomonas acroporae]